MFLTFKFKKVFKLSLTACCVVSKIGASLHILTFHDAEEEQKMFSWQKRENSKTLHQI